MVAVGDAAFKERIDSERNQGRAPDMGWLDHDRLGFNYRLTDIACAIGSVQLRPAGRHARRPRARGAVRYRAALADIEGLGLPCEDAGGERRGLVRVRGAGAARARPRRGHPRPARPRRAVQALPAGHPPHELLPRALRPSRGRVPGLRGRRRAVGRAAVLPGHDRGPGAAGGRRHWRRRSVRLHNRVMASLRADAERARRRRARRVGAVGFVGAAAAPDRAVAPRDRRHRRRVPPRRAIPDHGLVAVGAHGARPALLRAGGARGLARSRPALPPRRHGRVAGVGHHALPARASPSPPRSPRSPMV